MIQDKKILGIIPARGGSKCIPRKNFKILAGKPLIAWTIEVAPKSKYLDRFILSSEDEEIIEVARRYGVDVPFTRPKELAKDDTPGIDVVLHALEQCPDYDIVVLLQPTSPLRKVEDIDGAIEKMINFGAPACVSMSEPDKSPYWMYELDDKKRLVPLFPDKLEVPNRQGLPVVYVLNGAVYVAKVGWLIEEKSFIGNQTIGYIMPKKRSVDIDDETDFLLAYSVFEQFGYHKKLK